MGLNIDTSTSLRSPGQLAHLVLAVRSADPFDETHWLEWKIGVDLSERRWQARIAKFILGAANRRPQVAEPVCDGYAYMVLGAAPGQLPGCALIDSAQLDDGLGRFLGGNGPRYFVSTVVVSGTPVVAVAVERTPRGRRPYVAQREYSDSQGTIIRGGGIYVRRSSKTTEADAVEVEEMWAAARSEAAAIGPSWDLSVQPVVVRDLVPVDASEAALDRWIEAERERLTRGVLDRGVGMTVPIFGEDRSREAFYVEVDAYLDGARHALTNELVAHLDLAERSRVALEAHNGGDDSVSDLVLELELPDGFLALGWFGDLDRSERLAASPRKYGELRLGMGDFLSPLPRPGHSGVHVRRDERRRYVEFPPIVVPQRRSAPTRRATLLVPAAAAGRKLKLHWWAHSPERRGEASGEVELPISDRVLSASDVMALEPVLR